MGINVASSEPSPGTADTCHLVDSSSQNSLRPGSEGGAQYTSSKDNAIDTGSLQFLPHLSHTSKHVTNLYW